MLLAMNMNRMMIRRMKMVSRMMKRRKMIVE